MIEQLWSVFRQFWWILAIVLAIKVFLVWFNSPKGRGKIGELLVAGVLRILLALRHAHIVV